MAYRHGPQQRWQNLTKHQNHWKELEWQSLQLGYGVSSLTSARYWICQMIIIQSSTWISSLSCCKLWRRCPRFLVKVLIETAHYHIHNYIFSLIYIMITVHLNKRDWKVEGQFLFGSMKLTVTLKTCLQLLIILFTFHCNFLDPLLFDLIFFATSQPPSCFGMRVRFAGLSGDVGTGSL